MKVNEVPQDDSDFKGSDKIKKLVYAVGKDGKYTGVNTKGWEAESFATQQAWNAVEEDLKEAEEQLKRGEVSPIAYLMQKCLMDLPLLAKHVGKWQWQVKRHMKPAVFNKLPDTVLQKYADAFEMSVEELKNFTK